MNLDLPSQTEQKIELVHPQDSSKNVVGKSFVKHRIYELESDGFIHTDGSIHLRFSIMKHNFMKRVRELEEEKDSYRQIIEKL